MNAVEIYITSYEQYFDDIGMGLEVSSIIRQRVQSLVTEISSGIAELPTIDVRKSSISTLASGAWTIEHKYTSSASAKLLFDGLGERLESDVCNITINKILHHHTLISCGVSVVYDGETYFGHILVHLLL